MGSVVQSVRNALVYVLQNAKKHFASAAKHPGWLDPLSSAAFFRGWSGDVEENRSALRTRWKAAGLDAESPCKEPRSWLLRTGWKKHGLLRAFEVPAG